MAAKLWFPLVYGLAGLNDKKGATIKLHVLTSSIQKLKLIWRDGQFTYTLTLSSRDGQFTYTLTLPSRRLKETET